MITENLSGLKIHKLTQEQYDRERAAGRLDENAIYLTPEEEFDLSEYALLKDIEGIYETKTDAAIAAQDADRLFAKLMPSGTKLISTTDNPLDLNSVEYLKVGNYYCTSDATVKTMVNCPTSSIFLMQVYSPGLEEIDNETTKTYCYRIRKLINRNGAEYTQVCSTGATANQWTYGTWNKSMRTNHIAVSQTIKSGEKIGSITVDGKATSLYAPTTEFTQSLLPDGTSIAANVDLNSVDYLRPGNYYCSKDNDAKTILNSPSDFAFLMEVYSPDSTAVGNETTKPYCNRIRKLINRYGAEYNQVCSTGATANEWTYGTWNKVMRTNNFEIAPAFSNGEAIADITVDGVKTTLYVPAGYETEVESNLKLEAAKEYTDNQLEKEKRFLSTLIPQGTALSSSADNPLDLNNIEYLKVGNYYCTSDDAAKTITNCPSTSSFLMEVYSPTSSVVDNETTKIYCYRIRKIINRSGAEFTQVCSTKATANQWTYGTWNKSMRTNHIAVSSADTEGEKIGSITVDGKTTNLYYNERLNQKLVPSGTKITASSSDKKNINSLEYLKVGNYYCPQTAQTAYISNLPAESAFMMQVYSPLSETIDNETTKEWTYRIRKLTTYAGAEYTQVCNSSDDPNSWTYGPWRKTMKNNHFEFKPEYNSGIKIGQVKFDSSTPIVFYIPDTIATKEYVENYVSTYDQEEVINEVLNRMPIWTGGTY